MASAEGTKALYKLEFVAGCVGALLGGIFLSITSQWFTAAKGK